MLVLGIDGCRGGWFAVVGNGNNDWQGSFHTSISDLWKKFFAADRLLIDMPMGLPDKTCRTCDLLAKKILGRRHASIFMTPVRPAVYAETYSEACLINKQLAGKKISRQTWNIIPKMRELDQFIIKNPAVRNKLLESHPELAITTLNAGRPPVFSKKSEQGRQERLNVLQNVFPGISADFRTLRDEWASPAVAADDILDALMLCVTALLPRSRVRILPDNPETDSYNIPMSILTAAEKILK